MGNALKITW